MAESSVKQPDINLIETLGRVSKQDLHMETTSLLAQMVASAEPGSRLPTERELCAQLGVGRSTLREAMRALAFIGAIRIRQGSGTYVSCAGDANIDRLVSLGLMLQRTKVYEAIETRQLLEAQAVRMAASHHDASDRDDLSLIMRQMADSAANPVEACRYDLQFHVRLARASHNTVLEHFINGMRVLFQIWIKRAVNRQPVIEDIIGEHNAILDAVFARNADLAAARMTVHLTNAADRLLLVAGRNQSTADFISLLFGPNVEEEGATSPSTVTEAARV